MKISLLTLQDAFEQGKKLPYALLRTTDEVILGKTPSELPETLSEAHFFDEKQEIRIFWANDIQKAAVLTEDPSDKTIEDTLEIENTCRFGNKVKVSKAVSYDEDGQAYIQAIRLCGWEG